MFDKVRVGTGAAGRWRHTALHFSPNCLAQLEASDSTAVRKRSRLQGYVTELTNGDCSQYNQGDARVTGGLSRLVEDVASRLLLLSKDLGATGGTRLYPTMQLIEQYDLLEQDLHLGIDKALMFLAEEALHTEDVLRDLMTAFFYVGVLVFIAQVKIRFRERGEGVL